MPCIVYYFFSFFLVKIICRILWKNAVKKQNQRTGLRTPWTSVRNVLRSMQPKLQTNPTIVWWYQKYYPKISQKYQLKCMNVDKKNEIHKNLIENTKMIHVMILLLVCLFGTILCWQMLLSDKYVVTNLIGTVLQTTSYQLPGLFMIGWSASYGMAQITSILLLKRKAFLTKSTPNRSSAYDKNEIAQLDRLNGSSCAVRSFSDDYVDDFAAQILQERQVFDSKCIKVQHHLTIAATSKPSRIRSTLFTILAALSVLLTWHITIRVVLREARLII